MQIYYKDSKTISRCQQAKQTIFLAETSFSKTCVMLWLQ